VAAERIPITIYSICAYFGEASRPPVVDFSFTVDGREFFATATSSRHARATSFDREIFDGEIQIDAEGRYRVFLPCEEIGVLEVVDAAKVIVERFHEKTVVLNDFEVVDPPSGDEIKNAYEHWSRLARS
jgi:hypothetical protein